MNSIMKKKSLSCKCFITGLFVFLLLVSCGKKTMVRAPVKIRPPAVSGLKCRVRKNFVELVWQIPNWSAGKKLGRKIASFEIWRATITPSERNCPGCPKKFTEIGTVDLTYPYPAHVIGSTIFWKDLGVKVGNQYFYRLVTIDNKGNESLISNTIVANVSYPPVPPRITEAVATHDGINLGWKDPKKTVKGETDLRPRKYLLYRRNTTKEWKTIFPKLLQEPCYIDRRVEPGESYEYRVKTEAYEDGTPTLSDFSNTVKVVALELPPPAPPDTVWVLPSKGGVGVYWLQSGVDKQKIRYNVYRKIPGGEIVRLTDKPINRTSYIDKDVKVNEIYEYAVTSVRIGKKPSEGPYSKWVEIRFVPL